MPGVDIKKLLVPVTFLLLCLMLLVQASPGTDISVGSPENMSYNHSSVWLNFSVSGDPDWCAYSLNSEPNVTDIFGTENRFNDSSQEKNVSITQPGISSGYIRLKKNSTAVTAKMNVSGFAYDGWETADSNTSSNIWGIDFYSETFGFAVGGLGTILRWNGSVWNTVSSPVSETLNDVSVHNSTLAFAVTGNASGGYVIRWDGTQWEVSGPVTDSVLVSVDFAGSDLAFAGDQNSNLYKWNGSWHNQSGPFSTGQVRGISMINETFGFSAALSKIARWNGTDWTDYQDVGNTNFRKMEVLNSTYGFAASVATWGNEIVKWDGSGWYGISTPGTDDMWGVGVQGGRAFIVGENGRIVRCDGFDCSEAYSPTSGGLYSAGMVSGFGYIGGQGGAMLSNPVYPANVTLDVGGSGSPYEWNMTGEFNSTCEAEVDLNASAINDFLSSCSPYGGYCDVVLNFSSDRQGKVGMSDLSVFYTTNMTVNGTEGGNSLVLYANDSSGFWNTSSVRFTIDLTDPVINSTMISPSLVMNGSNVSLFINSTDSISGVSRVWSVVDLPNTSSVSRSLNNSGYKNFTSSGPGRYNVTFFANDSAGNTVNSSGSYFLAAESYNLSMNMTDSGSSAVNGSVTFYYPNSSEIIRSFDFSGSIEEQIPAYSYDVEFSAFNESLGVFFRDFNVSGFTGENFSMDRLSVPVEGYLNTYGLNATFGFSNATVTVGYGSAGFTSENHLGFHVCSDWNYTNRTCSGNWTNMTANCTQDNATDTFGINVTGFSGFAVMQESYCGDGTKDANETCDGSDFGGLGCSDYGFNSGSLSCDVNCSSISTSGCFNSASDPPGDSSPSSSPSAAPVVSAPEEENETVKCSDSWECGEWGACLPDGTRSRECVYSGNCSGGGNRTETGNCTYVPENATAEVCGDGICGGGENCTTCPEDCGECPSGEAGGDWFSHYWWLLPVLPVLAALGWFFRERYIPAGGKIPKEESLETEEKHLKEMIKLAQQNYYQKGIITRKTYDSMIDSYRQRMEEISRERRAGEEAEKFRAGGAAGKEGGRVPEKKRVRGEKEKPSGEEMTPGKPPAKKKEPEKKKSTEEKPAEKSPEEKSEDDLLRREKSVMLSLIKSAQNQYYRGGKISKKLYEMRVSAARNRIAEIEEELAG